MATSANPPPPREPERRPVRGGRPACLPRLGALALAALAAVTMSGVAIGQPAATIAVAPNVNPAAPGASVTFTADLSGVTPTGTVDFLVDGVPLCAAAPVTPSFATGRAICTSTTIPIGDHVVVAVYSGDADDGGVASAPLDFWVSTACRTATTPTLAMPSVTWLRSWRAGLASPTRVAIDGAGGLLVADGGTGEVVARAVGGALLTKIADGSRAVSVAAGTGGRLYVGDASRGRVAAYDSSGQFEFALGEGDGEFGHPGDIAVDAAAAEVFVSDTDRHRIGVYDAASGAHKRTLGRWGRSDGQFFTPTGLAIDGAALLVSDQLNYRIQAIDKSSGGFIECLGTYSQGGFISGGGGPGRSYGMAQGLALDAAGRLYVTDSFQGVVRVVDRAAAATLGTIGVFGAGGAQLRVPTDVAVDAHGRLFVAAADTGKLEVWGLDAYSDPEAVTHANATLTPSSFNRLAPPPTARVVLELASVPPSAIATASILVNGLAPLATAEGDADLNGQADLAIDVDATLLAASLGGAASGPVVVEGTAGGLAFAATATLTLTAEPLPTTTTLSTPVARVVAGTPVTLTATVTGLSPTGAVSFVDGTATLCAAVPLAAGVASCTTSSLPAGFHSLVASYGGDADDSPSASVPLDLDVLPSLAAVALGSSANPASVGAAVTLTADVAGLAPTGVVDFVEGTTSLCGAVDLAPIAPALSRAQCTTSALAIGAHDLVANYLGDNDNVAASSATLVQTVAPSATTTTLVSAPDPSAVGANATFAATVTGAAPTGGVTFREGTTVLCAAVVPVPQTPATAVAQCVVSTLAAGTHAVVAEFAGDAANLPSASVAHAHVVVAYPAIVTLASSLDQSTQGQAVTFTATVAGVGPTGTVAFADGATTLCASVALSPVSATTSRAACTTAALAAGTHAIVASYGGDGANGAAASSTLAQVVNSAGVTTVSGPSATGSGTITATISGCAFETWAFVDPPRQGVGRLGRLLFPHGLFEFTTTTCAPGVSIRVAITYPRTLLPGTLYWKFGPTAALPFPHWYVIPATIAGSTATFTITDGGLGDDDLAVDGRIVDQGGPSAEDVAAADGASAIPALSPLALALTALLVAAGAFFLWRRGSRVRRTGRSER